MASSPLAWTSRSKRWCEPSPEYLSSPACSQRAPTAPPPKPQHALHHCSCFDWQVRLVHVVLRVQKGIGAVTRQKPPMEHYTILHNLSGVFTPGRIALMLGPPGGGKSMLMKSLCGLAPLQVTGDITYNGHTQDEFNVRRTCRYVDQHDVHNPSLTVRETLTFSAMCQGPGYNRSAHSI
jgi:ABC-type glutathione transport system ATPase component